MFVYMKIISLHQPWASLVIRGAKLFETRSWRTDYHGPLLIHAAAHWDSALAALAARSPFREALGPPRDRPMPRGAVLGVVTLFDCARTDDLAAAVTDRERAFGDWRPGRWAWAIRDPFELPEPIRFRGNQGIRAAPAELIAAVRAQLPDLEALPCPA
jgi:hypothetical protein